jgi:hypothetical protein
MPSLTDYTCTMYVSGSASSASLRQRKVGEGAQGEGGRQAFGAEMKLRSNGSIHAAFTPGAI